MSVVELTKAVKAGEVKEFQNLLSKIKDINGQTFNGKTLIELIMGSSVPRLKEKSFEMISMALAMGLNINVKNIAGENALFLSMFDYPEFTEFLYKMVPTQI